MNSYCIYCGAEKKQFDAMCARCKQTPITKQDLGKSLLLWKGGEWEAAGLDYGVQHIDAIVSQIRDGIEVEFPEEDIDQAIVFYERGSGVRGIIQSVIWGIGVVALIILSVWYLFWG